MGRLGELRTSLRAYAAGYNRVRPTATGAWFLALALGVAFAALNTGNNLLYLVLSAFLCLLVVNNVLAEWNLRGLAVERCLPPELFAGLPGEGSLRLRNQRRLGAAFAVEVQEQDGGRASAWFDHVAAGAAADRPARWAFPRRGSAPYRVLRIGSSYPFGLLHRWRDVEVPGEVLVYPAIARDPPPVSPDGPGPGVSSRGGASDTGELQGLRPWQVGDPVRRIHARVSLRVGAPTIVLRAGDQGSEVLVTVDPEARGEAREIAIRRACGKVLWHGRRGDLVGLRADTITLPLSSGGTHRRRLLTCLALLPERP